MITTQIVSLCILATMNACAAQDAAGAKPGDDKSRLQAGQEDLRWWREARFGLFIHWGPVSLKGTEIGWSRGGERRGVGGTGEVPLEVYDNLYKQFNPTKFNADEWVAIAKAAGMKYIVFTSRHHDGFSMFDSKLTDYKITSPESPFRRDVAKELAEACHRAGMKLGFYYSQPDWHHPDYLTENHKRYLDYLHGQIRELCTNYGKLDILWFDGLSGRAEDWDAQRLITMIRELQPRIIINNRCGLPADHDTPEQEIGRFQNNRPWESCITIGEQWAWKPDDKIKSPKECLQTLIRCAGGDGNLLFNVGPMPTGEIEPRQVERLKQMGNWLKQYGQSIYATRGGPYMPARWGVSTHQGNTVYLHILNCGDGTVLVPPIPKKIVSHSLLTGGKATVTQGEQNITISIPPESRQDIDTVVVLQLDGPAADIKPLAGKVPSKSLALGKPATASNIFQNKPEFGPDKAFDDDDETRWATDSGTHEAWLEVDLGTPQKIGRVFVNEEYGRRVQRFELQSKQGQEWKTFASGAEIGPSFTLTFAPVTAQVVRLRILEAREGPTISEFQVFPP